MQHSQHGKSLQPFQYFWVQQTFSWQHPHLKIIRPPSWNAGGIAARGRCERIRGVAERSHWGRFFGVNMPAIACLRDLHNVARFKRSGRIRVETCILSANMPGNTELLVVFVWNCLNFLPLTLHRQAIPLSLDSSKLCRSRKPSYTEFSWKMKVHVNAKVWKEEFEYLNIGYRSLSVDRHLSVWHMFLIICWTGAVNLNPLHLVEAELLTRPVPTEQLHAVVGWAFL